jgi:hypothetical protein
MCSDCCLVLVGTWETQDTSTCTHMSICIYIYIYIHPNPGHARGHPQFQVHIHTISRSLTHSLTTQAIKTRTTRTTKNESDQDVPVRCQKKFLKYRTLSSSRFRHVQCQSPKGETLMNFQFPQNQTLARWLAKHNIYKSTYSGREKRVVGGHHGRKKLRCCELPVCCCYSPEALAGLTNRYVRSIILWAPPGKLSVIFIHVQSGPASQVLRHLVHLVPEKGLQLYLYRCGR